MGILAWIIVGLIAGWLAGLVMRGGGYGVLTNIIVGIVGGLLGGFVAWLFFGVDPMSGFNVTSIITAFLGALLLVVLMRALPGRSPL